MGTDHSRRTLRTAALVLLLVLGSLAIPAAASPGCTPGEDGCMPTAEQCAAGEHNGYWDGGETGRQAVCVGSGGHALVYAGGTVTPACGHVVIAGNTVPATGGDPNECSSPTEGGPWAAAAARLGLRDCQHGATSQETRPVVAFVTCAGEMTSFDGLEIDARLTFPAAATEPVPLVLLLHGWGGHRVWFQSENERTDVLGRGRFLAEGYATLATTARGFWASCSAFDPVADVDADGSTGPTEEHPAGCAKGWTHLAERGYEVQDSQHLLGQLVDAGLVDGDRLGVFGESYGGGQAWLLATSPPWGSPAGRTLRMAGAVSLQGWTDLLNALAPNGRADDRVPAAGRSRGPLGVLKTTMFGGLWWNGRIQPVLIPQAPTYPAQVMARYNTVDPTEAHSFIDGWMAAFHAGEPHEPVAAAYLEQALAGKSALLADDYFAAVARGEVEPTPVLALQGWGDALFTPVESVQMYRRLKQLRPDYPVHVAFGDGGHGAPLRPEHWSLLKDMAGDFLVSALDGRPTSLPPITSLRASCGGPSDLTTRTAPHWDLLAPVDVVLSADGAGTTSWVPADPEAELALDPFAAGARACATLDRAPRGSARWSWDVPAVGLETIGLQRVAVDYVRTGGGATLIARIWEVEPSGRRTLVTSGPYRLSADADPPAGSVDFALFGTHWRFTPGNRIELELSQTDAPFLRPGATPSTLRLSDPSVTFPTPRLRGSRGASVYR